jgi:hypothetical protein
MYINRCLNKGHTLMGGNSLQRKHYETPAYPAKPEVRSPKVEPKSKQHFRWG